jgi:Uma2 family endonuclease
MESTVRIQRMSSEEFFNFCQANSDCQIEQTADGEIIIMPPAGGETGNRNFDLIGQFAAWVYRDGRGEGFDSNTGFELPNGATRSPDLAWVSKKRLARLTPQQKSVFIPLCPDFVVEIKSPSDSLPTLRKKMLEWIENGAQLAWLIQPESKTITVYRPGATPEQTTGVERIAGEGPVAGFSLDLGKMWRGF